MNRVTLFGNVGRDPEIRLTTGGDKVATVALATTDRWKDKGTGEQKEKTEWHRIVVFGPQAGVIEKYVKKGDKLLVEGSIQTRKWVDQAGQEKYTTEIKLMSFDFGGAKRSESGEGEHILAAAAGGGETRTRATAKKTSTLGDDEIPW